MMDKLGLFGELEKQKAAITHNIASLGNMHSFARLGVSL
jgi:hypothetical protein